jgi:hypothetical protein
MLWATPNSWTGCRRRTDGHPHEPGYDARLVRIPSHSLLFRGAGQLRGPPSRLDEAHRESTLAPLTQKRTLSTVVVARETARPDCRRNGPQPSPAWRRLPPDARQPERPTRGGARTGAPLVESAPVRPHRPHPPTLPAPPVNRGGARLVGRQDRRASAAPHFRFVGKDVARAAQLVARGREGIRLGHARPSAGSPGPRESGNATCWQRPLATQSNSHLFAHHSLTRPLLSSSLWIVRHLVHTNYRPSPPPEPPPYNPRVLWKEML